MSTAGQRSTWKNSILLQYVAFVRFIYIIFFAEPTYTTGAAVARAELLAVVLAKHWFCKGLRDLAVDGAEELS